MDRRNHTLAQEQDFTCPVCGGHAKALLGMESEERRLAPPRIKCRKCEAEYWENQASGILQGEMD